MKTKSNFIGSFITNYSFETKNSKYDESSI